MVISFWEKFQPSDEEDNEHPNTKQHRRDMKALGRVEERQAERSMGNRHIGEVRDKEAGSAKRERGMEARTLEGSKKRERARRT